MITEEKRKQLYSIKLDRSAEKPLYAQINDHLTELIQEGFKPGDPFYSEQEITRALGVSRITIRRVIDDLDRAGHLLKQPNRKAIVAGGEGEQIFERGRFAIKRRSALQSNLSPRSTTITLLGLTWLSEFVMDVIDQLTAICKARGYEFRLRIVHEDEFVNFASSVTGRPEEEAFVLFVGTQAGKVIHRSLSSHGYRTVSIDTMPPDFPGAVVSTDARKAVDLGLEHLLMLGHEKIVLLVNEHLEDESVLEKIDEFKSVLRQKGLQGRVVITGSNTGSDSHDIAYEHMNEVWAEGSLRPTAIMTVSDPGAWAAQKWLREQGVEVPSQVSVVGFENARSSSHVVPPLTTIAHPVTEVVETAVEILLSSSRATYRPISVRIKPTLIERESTAKAPTSQSL